MPDPLDQSNNALDNKNINKLKSILFFKKRWKSFFLISLVLTFILLLNFTSIVTIPTKNRSLEIKSMKDSSIKIEKQEHYNNAEEKVMVNNSESGLYIYFYLLSRDINHHTQYKKSIFLLNSVIKEINLQHQNINTKNLTKLIDNLLSLTKYAEVSDTKILEKLQIFVENNLLEKDIITLNNVLSLKHKNIDNDIKHSINEATKYIKTSQYDNAHNILKKINHKELEEILDEIKGLHEISDTLDNIASEVINIGNQIIIARYSSCGNTKKHSVVESTNSNNDINNQY